jgi:hypothetical protein
LDRAQALAGEFNASAITLDALPNHLAEADIVISSTASPQPASSDGGRCSSTRRKTSQAHVHGRHRGAARYRSRRRRLRRRLNLYSIDDLQNFVNQNLKAREDEAREARLLIDEEVGRFTSGLRAAAGHPHDSVNYAPPLRKFVPKRWTAGDEAIGIWPLRRCYGFPRPPRSPIDSFTRRPMRCARPAPPGTTAPGGTPLADSSIWMRTKNERFNPQTPRSD